VPRAAPAVQPGVTSFFRAAVDSQRRDRPLDNGTDAQQFFALAA